MNTNDDAQIEQTNEEVVNGDVEETTVEVIDESVESVDTDAEDAESHDK